MNCTPTITYFQLLGWFFAGLFAGALMVYCATRYALSRYVYNLQRMEGLMLLTSRSVKWFGPSWGAPICDRDLHAARPVADAQCIRCMKGFDVESQGLRITEMGESEYPTPWHLDCLLQHIGGKR